YMSTGWLDISAVSSFKLPASSLTNRTYSNLISGFSLFQLSTTSWGPLSGGTPPHNVSLIGSALAVGLGSTLEDGLDGRAPSAPPLPLLLLLFPPQPASIRDTATIHANPATNRFLFLIFPVTSLNGCLIHPKYTNSLLIL